MSRLSLLPVLMLLLSMLLHAGCADPSAPQAGTTAATVVIEPARCAGKTSCSAGPLSEDFLALPPLASGRRP